MYHTGFGSVHKLANRVAKKAKLNLGQQRRVQANRERRLQKEHTTVVDDTLFGPAIEGVVISRFGQHADVEALILEPVVALGRQLAYRVGGEKLGPHRLAGGFPGHRLGAVFTKLEGAVVVVTPGAARAVEAIGLVDPQQVLDVLTGLLAAQHLFHGGLQGRKTAGFGGLFNMTHGTLRWDPPDDSWSS